MRVSRRVSWSAAAVALTLAAGCSSSGGGGSNGSAAGDGAASSGVATQVGAGRGAKAAGGGSTAGRTIVRGAVVGERSIVYTADLSVRVRAVGPAMDRATQLATAAGGFVFGQRTDGPRDADVTLKVPAARFTALLGSLGHLGTRLSTSESASDVSQDVIDLRSRVASARASVTRIRALLAKATKIGEIVEIEGELTQREADLESLEGQLGVLTNQVALSTIDLHLTAPRAHPAPAPVRDHSGFLGGLRGGWDAFVTAGTALVTAVGAVLPFAALAAIVAAGVLWTRRTWRARRPVTPTEG